MWNQFETNSAPRRGKSKIEKETPRRMPESLQVVEIRTLVEPPVAPTLIGDNLPSVVSLQKYQSFQTNH